MPGGGRDGGRGRLPDEWGAPHAAWPQGPKIITEVRRLTDWATRCPIILLFNIQAPKF